MKVNDKNMLQYCSYIRMTMYCQLIFAESQIINFSLIVLEAISLSKHSRIRSLNQLVQNNTCKVSYQSLGLTMSDNKLLVRIV
jgi:hypothetical protein